MVWCKQAAFWGGQFIRGREIFIQCLQGVTFNDIMYHLMRNISQCETLLLVVENASVPLYNKNCDVEFHQRNPC